jgi:hydroxymethylglutaryl-CoA reductase (NADPH)
MFPSSLLNKVYVPKSLKNTPTGYEFTLKNNVDTGTLTGIKSLLVDGAEIALPAITVKSAAREVTADAIAYRNPVTLRYSAEIVISVAGEPLATGAHEIKLTITVAEAGRFELKFSDEVA